MFVVKLFGTDRQVRMEATEVLLELMETLSPSLVLSTIQKQGGFEHKKQLVRQETLNAILQALRIFGAQR